MNAGAPKLFVSYSHDNETHKEWVLVLSTRLRANGVDVMLDQWDLDLGNDLPRFMESGLTDTDRILVVCSEAYVQKANAGRGGVGYEKQILTAQMMKNLTSNRIIPLIRNNNSADTLPVFLSSRFYVDFRNDADYEMKYQELIREVHGERLKPRPPLGRNPFEDNGPIIPKLSMSPERYVSPLLSGVVIFDYSNNDGRFVLGSGDMVFETAWSGASNRSIHAYNNPPTICRLALAEKVTSIYEISDATVYDSSSRARTPRLGEVVVWINNSGYFAAARIDALKCRAHGDDRDEVTFSYAIQPNKTACFTDLRK